MPEDETNGSNAEPTNPLPFEEFVRQHLALLLKAQTEMREKQDWLQKEMIERFVQLSQQIVELSARVDRVEERLGRVEEAVGKVREDIRDLEDKVDPFIREQLKLKRDLRELLESRTA
jgi:septal ring factor EnvC (AmiA/AmiB activator)